MRSWFSSHFVIPGTILTKVQPKSISCQVAVREQSQCGPRAPFSLRGYFKLGGAWAHTVMCAITAMPCAGLWISVKF